MFPRIGDVAKDFLNVITSPATLTDIWTTMSTFGTAYIIAIVLGITVGYVVSTSRLFTLAVAAFVHYTLGYTRTGRYLYALGSNAERLRPDVL